MNWKFWKKKVKVKKTKIIETHRWIPITKKFNVKKAKISVKFINGSSITTEIFGRANSAIADYPFVLRTPHYVAPYLISVDERSLGIDVLSELNTKNIGLNPKYATSWKIIKDSIKDHKVEYEDYELITEKVEVEE